MAEGRLPERNLIAPFLFPKFSQHKLFQTGNIWEDNFFSLSHEADGVVSCWR